MFARQGHVPKRETYPGVQTANRNPRSNDGLMRSHRISPNPGDDKVSPPMRACFAGCCLVGNGCGMVQYHSFCITVFQ